jgi:glycosyltransferase involved in cell wall biosynthesis
VNVLVLTPSVYGTAPGPRFRIEQWARYLQPHGYEFTFLPFEDSKLHDCIYRHGFVVRKTWLMAGALLRRITASLKSSRYDVIFLHREASMIGPALIERLIALRSVPLVYDFDDPIWMRYRSPTNHRFSLLKFPEKAATICKLSNHVIVGNHLLAQYASRYSTAVSVVPSTIDLQQYATRRRTRGSNVVTLGWTGSHSTVPFLEELAPVLRRLATKRVFRLVVISHTDSYRIPDLGAPLVSRRWNAATEAEDLADIDIGLAPFPNRGWTPWRCHGKVLQYMAAAIPTIASPIGIIPEYIQDGISGCLAGDETEWLKKLIRLIDDAEFRNHLGAEGRKVIQARYSAQMWAPQVGRILGEAGQHYRHS